MAIPAEYIVTASDRRAAELGYIFSQAAVDHAGAFFATLRDPVHPGRPFQLLPWQSRETARLLGWRTPDGRRRRFDRLNVWVPKKNGKSLWLAALALYFFLADGEPSPGCYIVSGNADLSAELYREAKRLTRGTRWRRLIRFTDFRKLIQCERNDGRLQALACSSDASEGLKGSFVCLDEIHVTLQREPELYGALAYAGVTRAQPLVATISTAGDDPQGLPHQVYEEARRILDGSTIDLQQLAIVYECAGDRDEYSLEEMVAANPGVGHILTRERLAADYADAKAHPHKWEGFLRYRLNVWTRRATAWLRVSDWAECPTDWDLSVLAGRVGYWGVDLSGRMDLTSACLVVPLEGDEYAFLPHYWLPAEGVEGRRSTEMDYAAAAAGGHITLQDSLEIDYADVRRHISQASSALGVTVGGIGFDPYKAKELAAGLEADGHTCWKIPQGWAMSEPSGKFEAIIKCRRALHRRNPVMAWNVSNVKVRRDGNSKLRPVKIEEAKKIDGVVAAIMGLNVAMFSSAQPYVYG